MAWSLAFVFFFFLARILSSLVAASAAYFHFWILVWKIPLVRQQKSMNKAFDNWLSTFLCLIPSRRCAKKPSSLFHIFIPIRPCNKIFSLCDYRLYIVSSLLCLWVPLDFRKIIYFTNIFGSLYLPGFEANIFFDILLVCCFPSPTRL